MKQYRGDEIEYPPTAGFRLRIDFFAPATKKLSHLVPDWRLKSITADAIPEGIYLTTNPRTVT